jgi:hypothetical protein
MTPTMAKAKGTGKGNKLKKVHLCCYTSDFTQDKAENIKRWVEANGGVYSKAINEYATHLICSEKSFKKNVEMVKQAKRVRGLKIVSFDWLEDTLLSNSTGVKNEKDYMWDKTILKKRKAEIQKKKTKEEIIKEGGRFIHHL